MTEETVVTGRYDIGIIKIVDIWYYLINDVTRIITWRNNRNSAVSALAMT